ncbi:hypothetical protein Tco_0038099 [Tanacetum coccineum]
MDDPNINMKEYIKLEEEKAHRRGKVYNWETAKYDKIWYDEDVHDLRSVETEFPAIVLNDALTSEVTFLCEPTVSPLNDNQIDFIISFDESDDEDYTVINDKNSFSYKIISINDLKTDSENDNEKFNMPSFLAIVYNDALTSKLDSSTEPVEIPYRIDEFDLKTKTSLPERDEKEQNVLFVLVFVEAAKHQILGGDQLLMILCGFGTKSLEFGISFLSMTISGAARVGVRTYLLGGAIDGSEANGIIRDPKLELESSRFTFDLVPLSYESVDVVVGENWLLRHKAEMVCHEKVVKMPCVPKELVGFTPRRRIGFRMELVQGATPICEGSCRLTSLERQEVWNDCRSCKVRVGSNGNLLWEASVLLGRKKGGVHGDDVAKTVFRMRNGHVEVYGYAFWVNQCTSGFHGVNEPGGVRVAREDDRGVTEGREDVREVFQQRGSGAKRKLSRCGRNQMGNEPILALPEGADDFVVYYDARSKDLEA